MIVVGGMLWHVPENNANKNNNNKLHTKTSFRFPSVEDFKLELMCVIANITAKNIKENQNYFLVSFHTNALTGES